MVVEVYDIDDATQINKLDLQELVGDFTFTLGKVVSGRNQEANGQLDLHGRQGNSKIKIMGSEKKANYGASEASFLLEGNINHSGMIFALINKFKGPGKYQPVFKTECTPKQNGKFEFGVIMDTDTLCDANDSQEILVQMFSYDEKGNHKKVTQGTMTLGDLKISHG